jgi:hypothetical protein
MMTAALIQLISGAAYFAECAVGVGLRGICPFYWVVARIRSVSRTELEDGDEARAGQGTQWVVEVFFDLDLALGRMQESRDQAVVAMVRAVHGAAGAIDLHLALLGSVQFPSFMGLTLEMACDSFRAAWSMLSGGGPEGQNPAIFFKKFQIFSFFRRFFATFVPTIGYSRTYVR